MVAPFQEGLAVHNANRVKVNLHCDGCPEITHACVAVDREVPEPLRCGGGSALPTSGSGGHYPPHLSCGHCGRPWVFTSESLTEEVNQLVHRGGWGEFIRHGGVDVRCRLA